MIYRIQNFDLNNGPGCRVSIWFTGCPIKCKGCHNDILWDPNNGQPLDDTVMNELFTSLNNKVISGVSILGGEPLAPYNIHDTIKILRAIKARYGEKFNIYLWTGYDFETAMNLQAAIFDKHVPILEEELVDVIIDGPYNEKLPTTKAYRGSDNQRKYVYDRLTHTWKLED